MRRGLVLLALVSSGGAVLAPAGGDASAR